MTKANTNIANIQGGWHVIQYRFDGSVDFLRSWIECKAGFGDLNGEFIVSLHTSGGFLNVYGFPCGDKLIIKPKWSFHRWTENYIAFNEVLSLHNRKLQRGWMVLQYRLVGSVDYFRC